MDALCPAVTTRKLQGDCQLQFLLARTTHAQKALKRLATWDCPLARTSHLATCCKRWTWLDFINGRHSIWFSWLNSPTVQLRLLLNQKDYNLEEIWKKSASRPPKISTEAGVIRARTWLQFTEHGNMQGFKTRLGWRPENPVGVKTRKLGGGWSPENIAWGAFCVKGKMQLQVGFEPRASRMLRRCDATTPRALYNPL